VKGGKMVENKRLKNRLILATIILVITEIPLYLYKDTCFLIDIFSNIMLGVIGSSVMALITYNYKKEECKEKLSKELLNIYSKFVIFKVTYSSSDNKNELILKLQNEINDYIGDIHDIEYDFVYKLGEISLNDTIVLKKFNVNTENDIANNFEVKNNRIIIKTKGLINQKEFISSYNKMLGKVRDYLNKYCMPKYSIQYELLKKIDEKYEEIDSKSNKKIHYTYSHK
jgi:hypothetical protein